MNFLTKTICFMYCLLLFPVVLWGQNKGPELSRFPLKDSSVWKVGLFANLYECRNSQGNEYFKYFFIGDTIINSTNYFKLYRSGTAIYDTTFNYESIYVGALRDSANKFFLIEKDKASELLLFDFNLKTGDSFVSALNNQQSQIINIDTLPDGRKIFECNKSNIWGGKCGTGFIIEGIGNNGGLLEAMPCEHVGVREHYLICYAENNKLVYSKGYTSCKCDIIEENPTSENYSQGYDNPDKIICYPVPAREKITVDPGGSSFISYEIYNFLGYKTTAKVLKTTQGTFSIDISELVKGIYLLKLYGSNIIVVKKIIIN